jgi:hypothetical protein
MSGGHKKPRCSGANVTCSQDSDLHAMLQWKYSLHFLIQQPFKQKLYMFKTEQAATLDVRKSLKT